MSANNTKMFFRTSGEGAFVNELHGLMEVPELGGTPEKIEVTTLGDKVKRYIHGIKDMGELAFKFLYDNSVDGNYEALKRRENTATDFRITYPDGANHDFTAYPTVTMDAGSINSALTFTCTMTMNSDITVGEPTRD